MTCLTCGGATHDDNPWGPWCDVCGGVSHRAGQLLFRYVATVDGQGGRFPIMYDLSTRDYAYMLKATNPRALTGKRNLDGFKPPTVQIAHGTLDAMIALSYPDAGGDFSRQPELSVAPSATEEERKIVLGGFA